MNNSENLYSKITARFARLGGQSETETPKDESPWENKIAEDLKVGANKVGIDLIMEKGKDENGNKTITYIRGVDVLTLTMHLNNFDVGEKDGTFYVSAIKEEYDKADWFRRVFEKRPVELHTIEKTDSGEVERVIYP